MSKELKDILSNLNKDIEQDKLLEYLNNELTQEEQHLVESSLNEDAFASDAMDGLQLMENRKDLTPMIRQLNKELKKKLAVKRSRRKRMKLPEQSWIYITVIILLVLVVLAYIIIHKMNG
jgi:hypothetical protein